MRHPLCSARMLEVLPLLCVLIAALTLSGCSSTTKEDELLHELANQDKMTIFDRAEELYVQEKFDDARRYFSFIYDTFPNDPIGHKAALRIADTYAIKKDSASLTEARLRFRDFANRYPNDPDRDYALLMLGQTYASRSKRPDRDLSTLEESLNAYNQLITLYPDSPYVDTARERIAELREILAEHEWMVAQFYARNKRWFGVQWRIEYLKEHYADFSKMAEVDVLMAEVEGVLAEREEALAKFRESMKQKDEEKGED